MNLPRIVDSVPEPAPPAVPLLAGIDGLAPYTTHHSTATPKGPLPGRGYPRESLALAGAAAVLLASVLVLMAALVVALHQPTARDTAPAAPVVAPELIVSGRAGPDRVHCMSDILTAVVAPTSGAGGVVVGWLDAPTGSLELLLEPGPDGYLAHLFVEDGVVRAAPYARERLVVWPGEKLVLRVQGLLEARELTVVGGATRLGSRRDDACA